MNQGRELTAEQVVEMAKSKLLQIYVPAGLSRSIGMPICEAVDMLTKLQEAWALDDAMMKAEQEKNPVPLFPDEAAACASSSAEDASGVVVTAQNAPTDRDDEITVEVVPATEEAKDDADRG